MSNPQLDELDWRKVYVGRASTNSDIIWTRTNMIDLKKGDIFKLVDQDETTVTHENGKTQFIASSDGYVSELGIPAVEIYA